MPFYAKLAQTERTVPLVVVGEEPVADLERYVAENGFKPDRVVSVLRGSLKVTRSPTLVLARSDGIVDKLWEGQLDTAAERDVLASVK